MNPKEYRYTQEHERLCPEHGTQHPTWSAGGKHHRYVRSRKRVWQVSNRSGRRLSVTCSGLGNKSKLSAVQFIVCRNFGGPLWTRTTDFSLIRTAL